METTPRRRWFQFSLKTLLFVTLLVASFLAGRASMINRVKDAELRSKTDRSKLNHVEGLLVRAVAAENDFKRRHGISESIRLRDLDLNEWGTWQPKSDPNP